MRPGTAAASLTCEIMSYLSLILISDIDYTTKTLTPSMDFKLYYDYYLA